MTLIAAVDKHWGIVYRGAPLLRVSADLRRFRALTMGHALLMGRKTFESLPRRGSPPWLLPGRAHVVLSRDAGFNPPGVTVLRNLDEARAYAQTREAFLIGGGEVYAALLDSCTLAHITKIDASREADAFMPDLDARPDWRLVDAGPWMEEDGVRFRFCAYAPIRCPGSSPPGG
jgi:dihydrofolate reductase